MRFLLYRSTYWRSLLQIVLENVILETVTFVFGVVKMMERKIRLASVNPHITCDLCRGYLIDATTITECLHTFCKSCIVKFLDENTTCPRCGIVIHQSYPHNYISFDRTMQDIVYKLVPNLQKKELKKQQDFYKKRGIPMPNATATVGSHDEDKAKTPPPEEETDHHRSDEQVNVCLECQGNHMKNLKRKFIRISSQATIMQLKKFISLKVYNSPSRYKDVDILCNEEILGKDHTLKFVTVTRWRSKESPLLLHYRQRVTEL
ncbi:polycomb group RING finger protein 3-like [Gigantopelta aegis]|uniref:polycomb group RING finger protein 3-like n=1 Tax=Gigantopelta aegis TaxID=1735272 RepID=UPI001B889747|nr:polycomb group RING finger protein 3-like [Gigantopelta aegis]